tara:strand:+ start:173 stop:628 length:456 start_codon:yes stop_codon:yes gene_type:complete
MAKWFIFENSILSHITNDDTKKDNFMAGNPTLVAKSVSDEDYSSVFETTKIATLSGDDVVLADELTMGQRPDGVEPPESLSPYTLDTAKEELTNVINDTKAAAAIVDKNNTAVIEALDSLDPNSITEIPTTTPYKWVLSQPGMISWSPLEL